MTQEQLQELTADIAEAIQSGSASKAFIECLPRFTTEVISLNNIQVTDLDDKQYLVTIKERNNE